MDPTANESLEWLEADGLGGFASGTASGLRTRRYHALLLTATTPPSGRRTLVNGFEAWVQTREGTYALTSQRYADGSVYPDGFSRVRGFTADPWPRWEFQLEDRTRIEQEIFVPRGQALAVVSWRLLRKKAGVKLFVRPLLSGRDYHALHHENPFFRFDAEEDGEQVSWRPYEGLPGVHCGASGSYHHAPVWYRRFLYAEERDRGLDHVEDLASPGEFTFDLSAGPAVWFVGAAPVPAVQEFAALRKAEHKRRQAAPGRLERAADAYLVQRAGGTTILAGYPWFLDWGRDTFLALRGLCLATGRLAEARSILEEWSATVSEGMLPNRFVESGEAPEYNSVDASLWFVVAAGEFLKACEGAGKRGKAFPADRRKILAACSRILEGYSQGTRFGIHMDEDGLLAHGVPGVQLTWMDSKIGDWVVTPRTGKAVEIQALWLNALALLAELDPKWGDVLEHGLASFSQRFWNAAEGCLYDVVDVDHERGRVDASLRPNQILAVGGLPRGLLDAERARQVVDKVEAHLLTPVGLRSLAPGDPRYQPRYEGGIRERDSAYHQGTVWPWLLGPFVEAWLRVHPDTAAARREARKRFLEPLLQNLDAAGLGHLSEIADAEPPHTPRGCPFQAWSVGEALRLEKLLAPASEKARGASKSRR